jgi:hypothetical protein
MELEVKYQIRDDHIGIFDNFFPNELIDNAIEYFKFCDQNKITYQREDPEIRKDTSIYIDPHPIKIKNPSIEARGDIYHRFVKIFYDNIYPIYLNKFIYLKKIKSVIFNIKIQKTNPSEGYHIWHFESSAKELQNRTTSFILYLNDVNEGGETEFLYQKLRVKPLKNRLVLWPAAYTHIHRGNPPLEESKYILTGWTEIPI